MVFVHQLKILMMVLYQNIYIYLKSSILILLRRSPLTALFTCLKHGQKVIESSERQKEKTKSRKERLFSE